MDKQLVKNLIKEFLEKAGVLCTDVEDKDLYNVLTFNILTPEANLLIGKEGKNLQALNTILSQMVSVKIPDVRHVNVDVNGYKENAITDLRLKTRKIADDVIKTKTAIPLQPMSAYERMLVHSMFSDDFQIETESAGEGPERHIIIKYRVI